MDGGAGGRQGEGASETENLGITPGLIVHSPKTTQGTGAAREGPEGAGTNCRVPTPTTAFAAQKPSR